MTPTGRSDTHHTDSAATPAVSKWPVLAQLPDVSAEQKAGSKERGAKRFSRDRASAAADRKNAEQDSRPPQTGYRFDPPESFGPHMTTDQAAVAAATSSGRSRTTIRTSSQGEPWPATRPARTIQPPRNILPASNLFNMRGSSHARVVSAVVQFLLLFALFTVAGSFLLLVRTDSRGTGNEMTPAAPVADQAAAVLPAATIEPAANPTASPEQSDWNLPEPPTASRPHTQSPPPGDSAGHPAPAGEPPQAAHDPTTLPYPTTAFPPAVLPEGADGPLPRVRTTDQPVARLPGYVLDAPVHQAQDDRHEPSIH